VSPDGGRRDVARGGSGPGVAPGIGAVAGIVDLLGGESDRSRRFLGGLVAGALVGAAVAGMALVRRGPRAGRPGPRR
jgi:hypothetical protein